MRRVVITGLGAITPLGQGIKSTWEAMKQGKNGISLLPDELRDKSGVSVAALVKNFDPGDRVSRKEARRMEMFTQFAVWTAIEAWEDAGLAKDAMNMKRVGVSVGSGIGGLDTIVEQTLTLTEKGHDRVSAFFITKAIINLSAGHVAIALGAKGPCDSIVTACATGTDSVGHGYDAIRLGRAEVMVAGGVEAVMNPLSLAGFKQLQALTPSTDPEKASRPFDAERNGFVMGEGAGMLILEELEHAKARGARIYAELTGYGQSCDAYHITMPDPSGEGAMDAMRLAVEDAGLKPSDIDYINAHGTSTPYNDKTETLAIRRLFGEGANRLAVSSTKSMTGHLLGAAGAVEAAATTLAIYESFAPPTIGYKTPDPECELDVVPNVGRPMKIRNAISNSFGFGGHNSCIAISRYEEGKAT
jgi:3-oxoacyl-[acyl-carrier-protein] synthase II